MTEEFVEKVTIYMAGRDLQRGLWRGERLIPHPPLQEAICYIGIASYYVIYNLEML